MMARMGRSSGGGGRCEGISISARYISLVVSAAKVTGRTILLDEQWLKRGWWWWTMLMVVGANRRDDDDLASLSAARLISSHPPGLGAQNVRNLKFSMTPLG